MAYTDSLRGSSSFSSQRRDSGFGSDDLYEELWRACAGLLVDVPKREEKVFYFPQGHMEYVTLEINGVDGYLHGAHFFPIGSFDRMGLETKMGKRRIHTCPSPQLTYQYPVLRPKDYTGAIKHEVVGLIVVTWSQLAAGTQASVDVPVPATLRNIYYLIDLNLSFTGETSEKTFEAMVKSMGKEAIQWECKQVSLMA